MSTGLGNARRLFTDTEPILGLFASISLALTPGCILRGRRDALHRICVFVIIGALAFGVIHFVAQRRGSLYHFMPLICAVILLASLGLGMATTSQMKTVRRIGAALAVALAIACSGRTNEVLRTDYWTASSLPRSEEMAALLRKHAPEDEAVKMFDTVWGATKALLSERKHLSDRFIYDLHFLHDQEDPYIQSLIAELIAGLRDPGTRTILITRQGWGPLGKGYDRIERIPGVAEVIEEHFDMVEETGEARLYVRKPSLAVYEY